VRTNLVTGRGGGRRGPRRSARARTRPRHRGAPRRGGARRRARRTRGAGAPRARARPRGRRGTRSARPGRPAHSPAAAAAAGVTAWDGSVGLGGGRERGGRGKPTSQSPEPGQQCVREGGVVWLACASRRGWEWDRTGKATTCVRGRILGLSVCLSVAWDPPARGRCELFFF
jgi:hypothetical protein